MRMKMTTTLARFLCGRDEGYALARTFDAATCFVMLMAAWMIAVIDRFFAFFKSVWLEKVCVE